ncbi:glutathione S-transferase U17-like [Gastrolobium bilobum]|uniref:glutathione S-transferase U17-like n=1 Tax=Gastrolobium bilobum TaxID=150636 RepID=UPI002AAF6293|nr:glutathione S-transferase U17-like [Gastrolobium bilobum]
MARNDLKLLGAWFSPFALRVQIALNIKGLDYENVQETFNPKSDLLLQSNPVHKKIPVFFHGDKPLCESAIIVEYIDEVWTNGPSILPANAYDRANARFWGAYIDDKWFMSMVNILTAEDDEAKKPYFEQMEEVLVRMEDEFNKCSEGKAFFGGDKIGFIDIAFGSFLSWLYVTEKMNGKKMLDEAKTPALVKWASSFAADPSLKGLLPETDKLIEFAKVLQQKLRAAASAK